MSEKGKLLSYQAIVRDREEHFKGFMENVSQKSA